MVKHPRSTSRSARETDPYADPRAQVSANWSASTAPVWNAIMPNKRSFWVFIRFLEDSHFRMLALFLVQTRAHGVRGTACPSSRRWPRGPGAREPRGGCRPLVAADTLMLSQPSRRGGPSYRSESRNTL